MRCKKKRFLGWSLIANSKRRNGLWESFLQEPVQWNITKGYLNRSIFFTIFFHCSGHSNTSFVTTQLYMYKWWQDQQGAPWTNQFWLDDVAQKNPPDPWSTFRRKKDLNFSLAAFGHHSSIRKRCLENWVRFKLGGGFNLFLFPPRIWGNDPIWLICFKWVETTN